MYSNYLIYKLSKFNYTEEKQIYDHVKFLCLYSYVIIKQLWTINSSSKAKTNNYPNIRGFSRKDWKEENMP